MHKIFNKGPEQCPECNTSKNMSQALDVASAGLYVSVAPSQWISGVTSKSSGHLWLLWSSVDAGIRSGLKHILYEVHVQECTVSCCFVCDVKTELQ